MGARCVVYVRMKKMEKFEKLKNLKNHKFIFVIVYETLLFHTIHCEFTIFHADLNEVKFK